MIFRATLIASLFFSFNAFADFIVSCKDQKSNNGPIVFSYMIKSTASNRIASDLSYVDRAGVASIISSLQVAQYVAAGNSLYMMIDNPTETPILVFQADPRPNKGFSAVLREIANGKVFNRNLKCTLK